MKTITQNQFDEMLDLHDKWLRDSPEGRRADFRHTNLSQINMAGANMARSNMAHAYMARANMEGAYMEGANMEHAYMEGANMAGAYMAYAFMEGAYMAYAYMLGANMSHAYMVHANMARSNMAHANMAYANMAHANMALANIEGAFMEEEYGKLITKRPILQINNIGRDNSCLSAIFCEKGIVIRRGCFYGSLDEFEKQVGEVHGDSIHGKEYKAAIAFIKLHKDLWSEQND
jgi:hypothetical protein